MSDEKWQIFNSYFQSREQVVVRWGQIRIIWWVIMKVEAQVGQFLLFCNCPVSRSTLMQELEFLDELQVEFFLQNIQFHQQSWVTLCVDCLALWQIINKQDAILIPKNRGKNSSSWFFRSEIFWGGVSRFAATPLFVALSRVIVI